MGSPEREVSISEASPKRRIPTVVLRSSWSLEQEVRRRKITGNTKNTLKSLVSEGIYLCGLCSNSPDASGLNSDGWNAGESTCFFDK